MPRVVKKKLIETFKQKSFTEWLTILGDDFNGCVEPLLNFSEAVNHPQIKARDMVVSVPREQGDAQNQIAFPIKFSTKQAKYRFVGVQTGEHSDEILTELGFDQKAIQTFTQKGVFGTDKETVELL